MNSVTVFEIGNQALSKAEDFPLSNFPIIGIAVLILGCSIFWARKYRGLTIFKPSTAPILIVWGLIWSLISIPMHFSEENNSNALIEKYEQKQFEIAEGKVTVLRTQQKSGHQEGDLVKVGNKEFVIDFFRTTSAYKLTIAHGGHLKEGTYARIYHVGNKILRIDLLSKS